MSPGPEVLVFFTSLKSGREISQAVDWVGATQGAWGRGGQVTGLRSSPSPCKLAGQANTPFTISGREEAQKCCDVPEVTGYAEHSKDSDAGTL